MTSVSKILAFSDVHLGYEHMNYPAFSEFLDHVSTRNDIDKVVMVGDIFDLWRHNYHDAMKEQVFRDTFYKLQSTIDTLADHGVKTIFTSGNHDYMAENVIGDDLDVVYKHSYNFDGCLYKHGWEYDFVQTFVMFGNLVTPSIYGIITTWFPAIYQQFCRKPSEIPTKESRANSSWVNSIYEKASEFTNSIGVPQIVMGHTHNPTIKGNVIDCGDWIDSLSWTEISDGMPTIHKWREYIV